MITFTTLVLGVCAGIALTLAGQDFLVRRGRGRRAKPVLRARPWHPNTPKPDGPYYLDDQEPASWPADDSPDSLDRLADGLSVLADMEPQEPLEPLPPLASWCARSWHDGLCCAGSREQFDAAPFAPQSPFGEPPIPTPRPYLRAVPDGQDGAR